MLGGKGRASRKEPHAATAQKTKWASKPVRIGEEILAPTGIQPPQRVAILTAKLRALFDKGPYTLFCSECV